MAVAVAGCIFCTRMDSTATRISSPMDKAKTRPVFHSATNAPEITVASATAKVSIRPANIQPKVRAMYWLRDRYGLSA